MKVVRRLPGILWSWSFACAFFKAEGQVATVDISNATNPVVTFDVNPYIYAPDLPDDPTRIYLDALTFPQASDITSTNTLALEFAALVDAGVVEGFAGFEFGQYTALAPAVQTSHPDMYSLSPPTVYYTPPTNQPPLVGTINSGPFKFDFGTSTSPVAPGYTRVSQSTA